MRIWFWTWRQLALVWGGALLVVLACYALATWRGPYKFFILVPYPTSVRGAWMFARTLARELPLLTASLAALALAAALTLAWGLARLALWLAARGQPVNPNS